MLPLLASLALAEPPSIRVEPTTGDIVVDGILDEADWQRAEPATEFRRFQPISGDAPPGTTEVRFLQDDKNLYVGIRVRDSGYPIRARLSQRERINSDDQVGIYLDTFKDERSGYIFYLNPLGIQQDIRFNNGRWEPSWSTLWRSEGAVTPDGEGFDIEIAYPWRSFKYRSGEGAQDWGVMLTRKIPREGAKYGFPELVRNHPRQFQQAATLSNVRPPSQGSGFEIIPQLTAVQQGVLDPDTDRLVYNGLSRPLDAVRPSLDVRFGITPDLAANTTVNPDFSQVDADVTQVQLNQRFAFFFPEQRPFFTDGADFFRDGAETLYTRSIVQPLYGAKLQGREGGTSVGVLQAIDQSPSPSVNQFGAPGFDEDDLVDADGRALAASTSVARVRQDAFDGGFVGVTVADKRMLGASGFHDAGGADISIPMGDRWTVVGGHFQSYTADGTESLWGTENSLSVSRASGKGTGGGVWLADSTPGVRKETGFFTIPGATDAGGELDHTFEFDAGALDRWTPQLQATAYVEREGDHRFAASHGQGFVFGGIHNASVSGTYTDIREQGVDMAGYDVSASYSAEWSALITGDIGASVGRVIDFDTLTPAAAASASITTVLRPATPLRIDLTAAGFQLTPQRADTQRAALLRTRLAWQFTREWGFRLIEDWSTGTERDDVLLTSALLTWLKNPGTAVHIGYTERTRLEGGPKTLDRTVFAKASVLWRP